MNSKTLSLFLKKYLEDINSKKVNTYLKNESPKITTKFHEDLKKIESEKKEFQDLTDPLFDFPYETTLIKLLEEAPKNITINQLKGIVVLFYRFIKERETNQVYTVDTGAQIDSNALVKIAKEKNLDFKVYPKFTGCRVRIFKETPTENLKYTLMFFKSGKVNCLGINNKSDSYLKEIKKDALETLNILLNKKINSDLRLVNGVLPIKIPTLINLKQLYLFNNISNWKDIKYNNQLFPGAIWRSSKTKARVNFFSTGSAIVTGVRDFDCRLTVEQEFIKLIFLYLEQLNKKQD